MKNNGFLELIVNLCNAFSQVTAEQEFELYSKVCDVLFKQKRLDFLKQSVSFSYPFFTFEVQLCCHFSLLKVC